METPHILLVDDDIALLEALPHMIALRIHGVQVDTSDSSHKALDQIQKHDYDAIVSDIKMPGMDGLELLAKIQELRPEISYSTYHRSRGSRTGNPGTAWWGLRFHPEANRSSLLRSGLASRHPGPSVATAGAGATGGPGAAGGAAYPRTPCDQ